ncbi:Zinc finger CCCH domain-containing protein 46 [Zea mays]|uniref:Zinc finger CCCH domain-containing protein 46 n=1 Tax=Zea mays TaxID=4577 RepID=A0A1D6IRH7_MAIZE|nr:Zinc finger CCCH domain-containing protein 46 [Zea mays]
MLLQGGGGDDMHSSRFPLRSPGRMDRGELVSSPAARQIYLTFPADSTFGEDDVSNYFSMYGPVQDVRIPYQQKRMFGFVSFVYAETVRIILCKGNPHFVCDARVLVKPYKEKGKVPDRFRKLQHPHLGDFAGCTSPTGLLDSRDPFDLQQPQIGPRMMYGNIANHEAFLRRKLEEQQQAIELEGRRFMGLHLLDLKIRGHHLGSSPATTVVGQGEGGKGSGNGNAVQLEDVIVQADTPTKMNSNSLAMSAPAAAEASTRSSRKQGTGRKATAVPSRQSTLGKTRRRNLAPSQLHPLLLVDSKKVAWPWSTSCLTAPSHPPPTRRPQLQRLRTGASAMAALTMWLLRPSSHLHPPLSCPRTTPASFRRPGRRKSSHLSSLLFPLVTVVDSKELFFFLHQVFSWA